MTDEEYAAYAKASRDFLGFSTPATVAWLYCFIRQRHRQTQVNFYRRYGLYGHEPVGPKQFGDRPPRWQRCYVRNAWLKQVWRDQMAEQAMLNRQETP